MSERTEAQSAKKTAQSQTREAATDVDANAILSEHMYKFVYEPPSPVSDAVNQLSARTWDISKNAATLTNIERQSEPVREGMRNHSFVSAERAQLRVVETVDQLDLSTISSAIADCAGKEGSEAFVTLLKLAGASPMVERVRLGALQIRQHQETDAEKTFENAIRAEIAKESSSLPEVAQLKLVSQRMYEELNLRRTLPEIFDSNLTLIYTGIKDGALNRNELINAKKREANSSMSQTLIEYLLKNFDQMKNGDNSIDRADAAAYQRKVMLKGLPR